MSKTPSNLHVCIVDDVAHIKVTGRANFASGVQFKMLVNELKERGFNHFVLEVGECMTMDSTFLGVLAGLVLQLHNDRQNTDRITLELKNPNQRVVELLDNLGVSHLFEIRQGCAVPDKAYHAADDGPNPSRAEVSQTCLEAHQVLMAVNPDNIPKFKEVTQFLAEDLKKLKS